MDPLDAEQTKELKADLEALDQALRANLDRSEASIQPVSLDEPIGRISRIDAIQHQKMASAGHEANKIRLSQITRALQAYAEDEYGLCLDCGEPIGFRRLKVRPETPFCVGCQGAREGRR